MTMRKPERSCVCFCRKRDYETVEAQSGESALESMNAELPDLILLDVETPGISGFEVVKRLKVDGRTRSIPVIMVTGLGDQLSAPAL